MNKIKARTSNTKVEPFKNQESKNKIWIEEKNNM